MTPLPITPALLRAWDACWTDDEIAAAYAGAESFAPLEIAARTDISASDRVWVALQRDVIGERDARLVACWAARRVLARYEAVCPGDLRPRRAIEVAERYAREGATIEELDVARAAVCSAAYAAYAAYAAARAAAKATDLSAALSAVWAAASAEDGWDVSWDAALRCLTAILRGELDTSTPVEQWPDFGWPVPAAQEAA